MRKGKLLFYKILVYSEVKNYIGKHYSGNADGINPYLLLIQNIFVFIRLLISFFHLYKCLPKGG